MQARVHARPDGLPGMAGFGCIGRGTLPLIERQIVPDPAVVTLTKPSPEHAALRPGVACATCPSPGRREVTAT
jgi:homospermidine synthase